MNDSPKDLRADLESVEIQIANLHRDTTTDQAIDLLHKMDRIVQQFETLSENGIDLRPEATTIETVQRMLRSKAKVLVQVLDQRGGLAACRAQVNPPENHWWWYLDADVSQQTRDKTRRTLTKLGIIVTILAALIAIYMLFLRPDQQTRQKYAHILSAETQIQEQNYAQALENYLQAYQLDPEDPEIALMIGILYEALEQPAKASTYYQQSQDLYPSPALFFTVRSQKFALLGWYDRGEADALQAIELDDQIPLAYCALASALEGKQDIEQALIALEVCATLAQEQGQDELYVIAASRRATLLQMPIVPMPGTATPQEE